MTDIFIIMCNTYLRQKFYCMVHRDKTNVNKPEILAR